MIAGIDIGGTAIKAGVVDTRGVLLWALEQPTPQPPAPEAVAETIAALVKILTGQYPIDAVGVGCAGSVDPTGGIVTAGNFNWIQVPLGEILSHQLPYPVRITNDAQAALLAEWTTGACKGARHALMITFGTGIGGGIIANGQPYRGKGGAGGELGHVMIHAGGAPCTCGARGCFEAYASASALVRRAQEALPGRQDLTSARAVADGARSGDPALASVFDAFIDDVCAGLMSLIMIFAPEVVVLGGGLSRAGDFLLDAVKARLTAGYRCYAAGLIQPELRLARYGNEAGIIGGAAQFL